MEMEALKGHLWGRVVGNCGARSGCTPAAWGRQGCCASLCGACVCQAAILASSKSTTPLPLEYDRNPRSANEGAAHIATMTQLPVQTIHRDPQLLCGSLPLPLEMDEP